MNSALRSGALTALALLAACGETAISEAEVAGDITIDACALLSPEEIADQLGEDVAPGEIYDDGLLTGGEMEGVYSSTCLWLVESADSIPAGSQYVILHAMAWPEGQDPEFYLQSFHEASAHGVIDGQPVPLPIGRAAIWWGDGVAVAAERTSIGVSARLTDRDRGREVAEALATLMAPRLK